MILKCGRDEFELTEKDLVMFNGACYILITRKIQDGWTKVSPTVSKTRMNKLIKDGLMKEKHLENPPYKGKDFIYYSIQ